MVTSWARSGALAVGTAVLMASPATALSTAFVVQLTAVASDDLGIGVQVGDLVPGAFSHGDCADPACRAFFGVTAQEGIYFDLGYSFNLVLNGTTVTSFAFFESDVVILNGQVGTGFDVYASGANYTDLGLSPPPPNPPGFTLGDFSGGISISLTDEDGTVFDNGFIPGTLPALNAFEQTSFTISFGAELFDEFDEPTSFASFSASGVVVGLPEPSTGTLLGLGLLGAVGLGGGGRALSRRPR